MASRFYKLSFNRNNKPVNAIINLYAVTRIERCDNIVKIMFNHSHWSACRTPQFLELVSETEVESEEIYNGIENAMNPINKLA